MRRNPNASLLPSRRDYTMNDWGFVGRWEAARELAMCAYVDVVRRLDKIKMIAAFRGLFPYLSTIWQDDVHWAYFGGHRAGSRHAWKRSGKTGEPPGWEADEEEGNADRSGRGASRRWLLAGNMKLELPGVACSESLLLHPDVTLRPILGVVGLRNVRWNGCAPVNQHLY